MKNRPTLYTFATLFISQMVMSRPAGALHTNEFGPWSPLAAAPGGGTFIYGTATSVRGTILPLGRNQGPLYLQTYGVASVDHRIYKTEGGGWSPVVYSFNGTFSPNFSTRPAVTAWLFDQGLGAADARNIVIGLDANGSMWQATSGSDGTGVGELWGDWHQIGTGQYFVSAGTPDSVDAAVTYYPNFSFPTGLVVCALSNPFIGGGIINVLQTRVYCATNTDVQNEFPATSWSAFSTVPFTGITRGSTLFTWINKGPALAIDRFSNIWLAIGTTDGNYYWTTSSNGVNWGAWTRVPLGGASLSFVSTPALSSHVIGQSADIFGLINDHSAWVETTGESGFSQIPNGLFLSTPSALAEGPYRIDSSGIGTDGQIWRSTWISPDGN